MKKTKNAFTLIELLAVIVILAIIALIATPIILGIVEDAKKDAFLRSVELVISTTDIDIANKTFEEEYTYEITDGNISNLEVSVKNTDGMNGSITYDMNGKEVYAIHNGVYCVKKTSEMSKAEISDFNGDCQLLLSTSSSCFAFSDGTITDYYLYEDNDINNKECPRDVVIPSRINGQVVKAIGENAFEPTIEYEYIYDEEEEGDVEYEVYLNQITSVKFPNSVTSIGAHAFDDNALSGELDLSNLTNLISIGDYAFAGSCFTYTLSNNNQITSVKLPNSVTSIGAHAFDDNALSGELDLSHLTNLISIDYGVFHSNQIDSIKLPNSVTSIGNSAFGSNNLSGELDLSHLTNLTSVGGFDFNEITSIKFPDSITSIGASAFDYNNISGELDLSNTQVTTIGRGSFSGDGFGSGNQIISVKFPSTLESIGDYAFQYNKLSGELDLSNTQLTSIGDDAFLGDIDGSANQITSVKFPSTLESIEVYAFAYNKLTSITFYGRSDLTGLTIDSTAWGWADGYDETNGIHFINE